MRRVFVVTGLGYGDEGKGTTTHWLCSRYHAHTVIRTGGPQALHRVVTAMGHDHVHAQFGSGTLCGAATHLSQNMVIAPNALLNEGRALKYEYGIGSVFKTLTIHEDALVVTPFHGITNRLREMARGANRHGSVGAGVGETVLDAERLGNQAIRAKDLGQPHLPSMLENIKKVKEQDLAEIISQIGSWPEELQVRARQEIFQLQHPETVQWMMERANELKHLVQVVDTDYVARKILGHDGVVVFEGSQGVLLDRHHGFAPYVTKVRTLPETATSILEQCGYPGEITKLGVLRAYHTRHGAGPFVTESQELTEQLPDSDNGDHPWQGKFRVGHFDLPAAKYAIEACGGPPRLNGLVITCLDRIESLPAWKVCQTYDPPVTESLFTCRPQLTTVAARSFPAFLRETLRVPIFAISIGPTEEDKIEGQS